MIRACRIEDVPPGEGRALTVAGRRIALFRAETGWYALDHVCPHAGGPLADGILADCRVICPLHERSYDLASGAALSGGADVAAHGVQVRGDDVYVEVSPAGTPDRRRSRRRPSGPSAACPRSPSSSTASG